MIIFFFDNSITFRMARISKTYFGSEKNIRQLIISFDISFYIKPNAAFIQSLIMICHSGFEMFLSD